MKRFLPLCVTACLVLLMLLHGPIAQPLDYHHFADTRSMMGLPNAADVLSNIGFAVIGLWGWRCMRTSAATPGRSGYALFLTALILTAAGSSYYHLQPDDARLVWDRIPIALACAGLLAGVHGDLAQHARVTRNVLVLAVAAVASVVWWYTSGDLRPYLLLQALPLVLIPMWQWMHHAPGAERLAFAIAILLYIAAKVAELQDHQIIAVTGMVSGHTLKHVLATAAAASIVSVLARR